MSTSEPVQRLFNRVTDKIADGIIQASLNILAMLVRPMATLTELFFRRDMGERYFTYWNFLGGFFLLIIFSIPFGVPAAEKAGFDAWGQFHAAQSAAPRVVLFVLSFAWSFCLFGAYARHILFLRRNFAQGNRWHSYNVGIPRFPALPVWAEKLIPFVAAVAIYYLLHIPGLAILLVLSGIVSILLRVHEARLFRERVLDLIDGQIEQEYIATAVLERAKPEQVDGLRAPLPAYVSRTYRAKIVDALGERLAPNPFIQPAATQTPSATLPAAAPVPATNPFTTPAAPVPASPTNAIKPVSEKPTTAAPNASARFLTKAPTVDDPSMTQFTFAKAPSGPAATSPGRINAEFVTPKAETSEISQEANSTGIQVPLTEEERKQFDEFVKDNSFSEVPFKIDFTPDQVRQFLAGIEKIRKKLKRRKLTSTDLMIHANVLLEEPLNPPQTTKRKS